MVYYHKKHSKHRSLEGPDKFVIEEASRCLQCNEPNCIIECPYGVNIPTLLSCLSTMDVEGAVSLLRDPRLFDLGRECLLERPCEKNCTLAKKGKPVSIHKVEVFLLKEYKKF